MGYRTAYIITFVRWSEPAAIIEGKKAKLNTKMIFLKNPHPQFHVCYIYCLKFKLFPDYGDVYNIAWSGENRWLLAGTAAGLVGWNIDDDKVKKYGKNYR